MHTDSQTPRYADRLCLAGQAAIVLGAGQGMGEQCVAALAQQGAQVLGVDISEDAAQRVAQLHGGIALAADVTSREQMQRVFATAQRHFGTRLQTVVDVVGMVHPRDVADITDDDWRRQFDLVFTHAHLAIQYGAPLLAANGGGSLTFIGSAAGQGARTGRMLPYATAKAALNQLVRGAAKQWAAQGVRMNVVAPGLTRTPRLLQANDAQFWNAQVNEIPLRRAGETSDVAGAVLFFASGFARHVTGTVLPLDGGAHLLGESSYVPNPQPAAAA